MIVMFIISHDIYNAGEIAGFDDDIAQDYIRRGICKKYTEGKKPSKPARRRVKK